MNEIERLEAIVREIGYVIDEVINDAGGDLKFDDEALAETTGLKNAQRIVLNHIAQSRKGKQP